MDKIKPLKKFGQNYLRDQNIINKIISVIDPVATDHFLEIGPGQGALTKLLVEKAGKLTAVEIDTRVVEYLQAKFPSLDLVNADFLKYPLFENKDFSENSIRVAGNIPYNITSPILFKLIENRKFLCDCHLMMQLEVAERITAAPGTKNYGILAVVINYFADAKLCFKISPNVFYPKPKVYSAIVKIDFQKKPGHNFADRLFIDVVKASFGNRRKTLKNSLNNSKFGDCDFSSLKLDLSQRAEKLTIDNFIYLTEYLNEMQNDKGKI